MGFKKINIVVVRHPEKTGRDADAITAFGAQQAFAAALALGERFSFDRVLSSGANRTRQAALVMMAALDLPGQPAVDEGFHFKKIFGEIFPGDEGREKFFVQLAELKAAYNGKPSLAHALEIGNELGRYARDGASAMRQTLSKLALEMAEADLQAVLVLSHSPWTELAGADARDIMPFGLGEADAVCYTFQVDAPQWVLERAEWIKAPLAG